MAYTQPVGLSFIQLNGNGSTTTFTFPFQIYDDNDLQVFVVDNDGHDDTNQFRISKTVSKIRITPAPSSNHKINIIGLPLRIIRNSEYQFPRDITPEALNAEFDRLYSLLGGLFTESEYTVKLPLHDELLTILRRLPDSADRANKLFFFDTDGNLDVSQIEAMEGGPVTIPPLNNIPGVLGPSKGGTGQTSLVGIRDAIGAAPLDSPALTGTPTTPTANSGDSSTQVANTEFVTDAITAKTPSQAETYNNTKRIIRPGQNISIDNNDTDSELTIRANLPATDDIIEANPSGSSGDRLTRVSIDGTNYNIVPSPVVVANPSGSLGTLINRLSIDGQDYNIDKGSVVEPNTGSGSDLSELEIDGDRYTIKDETIEDFARDNNIEVPFDKLPLEVNPSGDATDALDRLDIDGTVYAFKSYRGTALLDAAVYAAGDIVYIPGENALRFCVVPGSYRQRDIEGFDRGWPLITPVDSDDKLDTNLSNADTLTAEQSRVFREKIDAAEDPHGDVNYIAKTGFALIQTEDITVPNTYVGGTSINATLSTLQPDPEAEWLLLGFTTRSSNTDNQSFVWVDLQEWFDLPRVVSGTVPTELNSITISLGESQSINNYANTLYIMRTFDSNSDGNVISWAIPTNTDRPTQIRITTYTSNSNTIRYNGNLGNSNLTDNIDPANKNDLIYLAYNNYNFDLTTPDVTNDVTRRQFLYHSFDINNDGDILVTDGTIIKEKLVGSTTFTTLSGPPLTSSSIVAVAYDPNGNRYVLENENNKIWRGRQGNTLTWANSNSIDAPTTGTLSGLTIKSDRTYVISIREGVFYQRAFTSGVWREFNIGRVDGNLLGIFVDSDDIIYLHAGIDSGSLRRVYRYSGGGVDAIGVTIDNRPDDSGIIDFNFNSNDELVLLSTRTELGNLGNDFYNSIITVPAFYQYDGNIWSLYGVGGGGTGGLTTEQVDDRVNQLLTAGDNITLTYNDNAGTLVIASTATGGGGGLTTEQVDDRVNRLLTAGDNITLTYNDNANTLTIASTGTGGGGGLTISAYNRATTYSLGDIVYTGTTGIRIFWIVGDPSLANDNEPGLLLAADDTGWELLTEESHFRGDAPIASTYYHAGDTVHLPDHSFRVCLLAEDYTRAEIYTSNDWRNLSGGQVLIGVDDPTQNVDTGSHYFQHKSDGSTYIWERHADVWDLEVDLGKSIISTDENGVLPAAANHQGGIALSGNTFVQSIDHVAIEGHSRVVILHTLNSGGQEIDGTTYAANYRGHFASSYPPVSNYNLDEYIWIQSAVAWYILKRSPISGQPHRWEALTPGPTGFRQGTYRHNSDVNSQVNAVGEIYIINNIPKIVTNFVAGNDEELEWQWLAIGGSGGSTTLEAGDGITITESGDISTISNKRIALTQAEYDALTRDDDTLYLITDTVPVAVGGYLTTEEVDDRVNQLLTAGDNITLTYDDVANSLIISSTATGGGTGLNNPILSDEQHVINVITPAGAHDYPLHNTQPDIIIDEEAEFMFLFAGSESAYNEGDFSVVSVNRLLSLEEAPSGGDAQGNDGLIFKRPPGDSLYVGWYQDGIQKKLIFATSSDTAETISHVRVRFLRNTSIGGGGTGGLTTEQLVDIGDIPSLRDKTQDIRIDRTREFMDTTNARFAVSLGEPSDPTTLTYGTTHTYTISNLVSDYTTIELDLDKDIRLFRIEERITGETYHPSWEGSSYNLLLTTETHRYYGREIHSLANSTLHIQEDVVVDETTHYDGKTELDKIQVDSHRADLAIVTNGTDGLKIGNPVIPQITELPTNRIGEIVYLVDDVHGGIRQDLTFTTEAVGNLLWGYAHYGSFTSGAVANSISPRHMLGAFGSASAGTDQQFSLNQIVTDEVSLLSTDKVVINNVEYDWTGNNVPVASIYTGRGIVNGPILSRSATISINFLLSNGEYYYRQDAVVNPAGFYQWNGTEYEPYIGGSATGPVAATGFQRENIFEDTSDRTAVSSSGELLLDLDRQPVRESNIEIILRENSGTTARPINITYIMTNFSADTWLDLEDYTSGQTNPNNMLAVLIKRPNAAFTSSGTLTPVWIGRTATNQLAIRMAASQDFNLNYRITIREVI